MKALLAPITALLTVVLAVLAAAGLREAGDYRPPHVEPPVAAATWPLEAIGISPDQLVTDLTAFTEGIANAQQAELDRLARNASTPVVVAPRTGTSEASAPDVPVAPQPGCGVADLIRAAWADTPDAEWAIAVAMRESHCTSGARNPSGASGIFQLMMPLHRQLIVDVCGEPADDLVFDAACNINAARALYAGAGRSPWGG